jgi:hypothetical protein
MKLMTFSVNYLHVGEKKVPQKEIVSTRLITLILVCRNKLALLPYKINYKKKQIIQVRMPNSFAVTLMMMIL